MLQVCSTLLLTDCSIATKQNQKFYWNKHYPDKAKSPTGTRETSKTNNKMAIICWMQAGYTGNSVGGSGCVCTDVAEMKRTYIQAFIPVFPVFRTYQIKVPLSFHNFFFFFFVSWHVLSFLVCFRHICSDLTAYVLCIARKLWSALQTQMPSATSDPGGHSAWAPSAPSVAQGSPKPKVVSTRPKQIHRIAGFRRVRNYQGSCHALFASNKDRITYFQILGCRVTEDTNP